MPQLIIIFFYCANIIVLGALYHVSKCKTIFQNSSIKYIQNKIGCRVLQLNVRRISCHLHHHYENISG